MRFRFGTFVLDVDGHRLTEGDRVCHLTPKAFALLTALVSAPDRVHTKGELYQLLWPGAFVVDANLSNLVAEVREALGDHASTRRFIRTAHRVGYAFVAEVAAVADATVSTSMSTMWLEWGRKRFSLTVGAHIVGRDPDVEVPLDATTVSRRHARITVTADGARLEDLQSKNGTWRGDDRATGPLPLADGDEVRFGDVLLTFRARRPGGVTDTHVIASP